MKYNFEWEKKKCDERWARATFPCQMILCVNVIGWSAFITSDAHILWTLKCSQCTRLCNRCAPRTLHTAIYMIHGIAFICWLFSIIDTGLFDDAHDICVIEPRTHTHIHNLIQVLIWGVVVILMNINGSILDSFWYVQTELCCKLPETKYFERCTNSSSELLTVQVSLKSKLLSNYCDMSCAVQWLYVIFLFRWKCG